MSFTIVSGGATTVTVMVELTTRSRLSSTWYVMGVAVPENVGSGSNVTVPSAFTV